MVSAKTKPQGESTSSLLSSCLRTGLLRCQRRFQRRQVAAVEFVAWSAGDDRIVLVGDSAVTRLYKDGIGAAYRTAEACAVTAVFEGITAEDFRCRYWPVCRRLERDNHCSGAVFAAVSVIRKLRPCRLGVLQMVRKEQRQQPADEYVVVGRVYGQRCLQRDLPAGMGSHLPSPPRARDGRRPLRSRSVRSRSRLGETAMHTGDLGKARADGEINKVSFLKRVHEDPSLAFRILQKMAERIRELDAEIVRLTAEAMEEP